MRHPKQRAGARRSRGIGPRRHAVSQRRVAPAHVVQARLLDLFQQHEREGHGRSESATPAARLIAAATGDLEAAVAEHRFHRGLYYYLSTVRIFVPPLRERPEDIGPLAEHFLDLNNPRRNPLPNGAGTRFSAEAWQCLLHYHWPGNVLQLARVVAGAVALADKAEIGPTDIAKSLGNAPARGRRCPDDLRPIGRQPKGDGTRRSRRGDPPLWRKQGGGSCAWDCTGGHFTACWRKNTPITLTKNATAADLVCGDLPWRRQTGAVQEVRRGMVCPEGAVSFSYQFSRLK